MEQVPLTADTPKREVFNVKDGCRSYWVDTETGEILNPPPPPTTKRKPIKRNLRRFGYVGVDTPWPSSARDAEELRAALEQFDWWADQTVIDTRKILGLLDTGINDKAVRAFHQLAKELAGRNYWYGTVSQLRDSLQLSQRATERALSDLEQSGLIKRKHQGKYWPMRITLHPWYAWRGDYSFRSEAIACWLPRTAKTGGEVHLQAGNTDN